MKKSIKISLWVLGGIIGLVLLGGVAGVLWFNPNHYKPEIESAVYQATGRHLVINGSVKLSVIPHLGFSIEDATLSNPPGYTEPVFAHIDSAQVSIALWPLLHKDIEADSLMLNGLSLNLIRLNAHQYNWQFNARGMAPSPQEVNPSRPTSPAQGLKFHIKKLAVSNANINFEDVASQQQFELEHLNFDASHITPDQAFPISVNFAWQSRDPALKGSIGFTSKLGLDQTLQQLSFDDLDLLSHTGLGTQGTLTLQLQGRIKLDFSAQTLNSDLSLSLNQLLHANIRLQANNILKDLAFNGDVAVTHFDGNQLLKSLNLPAAELANPDILDSLAFSGRFNGNLNAFMLQDMVMIMGPSTLQGALKISPIDQPHMVANVNINQIDLANYLNLYGALFPLSGVQISADLNAKGWQLVQLSQTLSGNINLVVQQASLKGLDIGAQLNSLQATINAIAAGGNMSQAFSKLQAALPGFGEKFKIDPNNGQSTQFTAFSSDTKAVNGKLTNQLALSGRQFQIQGQGTMTLPQQGLIDYTLQAYPLVEKASGPSLMLPIKIKGTPQQLSYGVQMDALQKLVMQIVADRLKDKVENSAQNIGGLLQQIVPH